MPRKVKCYGSQAGGIVTAPSDADETDARYFANAPTVTGDFGRVHFSRR